VHQLDVVDALFESCLHVFLSILAGLEFWPGRNFSPYLCPCMLSDCPC
jgi:hypothetical protein